MEVTSIKQTLSHPDLYQDWFQSAFTVPSPREANGSLKVTHSNRSLLSLCHMEFLFKVWGGSKISFHVVLLQSQGLTVVYEAMWRPFLQIPRCCEMKGACHLTLLGSDGAQLLLKIWDRIPLWDLQGFLYLAVGLHHSWVLTLNPQSVLREHKGHPHQNHVQTGELCRSSLECKCDIMTFNVVFC